MTAVSSRVETTVRCADGYPLHATVFEPDPATDLGRAVIVTAATGAKASYYHRFASFLAERGFFVLVADYRGVASSAPAGGAKALRSMRTRWHEWGTSDAEALIRWTVDRAPGRELVGVGHSFGGLALCLAPSAAVFTRLLLVGAQHAHWPDYARTARAGMLWRWHVVMPVLACLYGRFPGRLLGWSEDFPRGVAFDWARGRSDFARTIGADGAEVMARVAALTCDVRAVAATDDPFATPRATDRLLAYLSSARTDRRTISPAEVGADAIGHLGLFHDRFRGTVWPEMAEWLRSESTARQQRSR